MCKFFHYIYKDELKKKYLNINHIVCFQNACLKKPSVHVHKM